MKKIFLISFIFLAVASQAIAFYDGKKFYGFFQAGVVSIKKQETVGEGFKKIKITNDGSLKANYFLQFVSSDCDFDLQVKRNGNLIYVGRASNFLNWRGNKLKTDQSHSWELVGVNKSCQTTVLFKAKNGNFTDLLGVNF